MRIPDIEAAFQTGRLFEDPYGLYRRLREYAPVYWSPYLQQWLITSYELVEEVLRQPRRFSNFGFDTGFISRLSADDLREVPTLDHHFRQQGLIQADPPEHTRLRRALGPHFTAKTVSRLADQIETAVADLLDDAEEEFDVIRDLGEPLPVRVIADLVGVPEANRRDFPKWSADAVRFIGTSAPDPANARALDDDLVAWRGLMLRLLDERRALPQEDLLTAVSRLIDEGSISVEEALFSLIHLLVAGHETTTNLIGNTLLCLLTYREQMAAVVEDHGLIPGAIEEVLRFEPPIHRVRRVAVNTGELGGVVIRAGDPVIPVLAAANRDPARFAKPGEFDVHRDLSLSTTRHVGFGHGVHLCVGAPLARLEAPEAVGQVLERYPDATLPEAFVPVWRRTINLRGLRSLPINARLVGLTSARG